MTAILSGDYRHILYRGKAPYLGFIMLNPSTADATSDDPTIRKCVGFATRWGYNGIVVGNLFQYRCTKRRDLWKANDPVGPRANKYLRIVSHKSSMLIAAWGVVDHPRAEQVQQMFRLRHIGPLTKDGHPRHPLYLGYNNEHHIWNG